MGTKIWIVHSYIPNFCICHQRAVHGGQSEAFFRSTNAKDVFFFLCKYFFCSCLSMKMASIVPLPGIKPNDMLWIGTCFRIIVLRICSRIFITSFHCLNLRPLQFPQDKASPFTLKRLMMYNRCQSFGTLPSYTIWEWCYIINNSIVSSLNNVYDNTWVSSSFSSLHFVDPFRHHLSSNLNCRLFQWRFVT